MMFRNERHIYVVAAFSVKLSNIFGSHLFEVEELEHEDRTAAAADVWSANVRACVDGWRELEREAWVGE